MSPTITARFPSTCAVCGAAVGSGERISTAPGPGGRDVWAHEACAAEGAAATAGITGSPSATRSTTRRTPARPVRAARPPAEVHPVRPGTTAVWTDGACSGNPGPGGWAWAVPDGRQGSGASPATTNQRMEVQAAFEAVRALPGPLVVVSDSTYVVNCFRDGWWRGWVARGWTTSAKKPVANRDLWEPLVDLVRDRGDVEFRWVKGHSGDAMNDLVDRLAVEAGRLQRPAAQVTGE